MNKVIFISCLRIPSFLLFLFSCAALFSQEEAPPAAKNPKVNGQAPTYLIDPRSLLIPRSQFYPGKKNGSSTPLEQGQTTPAIPEKEPSGESSKEPAPDDLPRGATPDEQETTPSQKATPSSPQPPSTATRPLSPNSSRLPLTDDSLNLKPGEAQILFAPEIAEEEEAVPPPPAVPEEPRRGPVIEPTQRPPLPSYISPPAPPPRVPPEEDLNRVPRQLLITPRTAPPPAAESPLLFQQEPAHPDPGTGRLIFEEVQEERRVEQAEERVTRGDINFNNVSIVEYIRFLSRISGKNFIFDESQLQFNITVVSEEPTSIANLVAALLQELQVRGLSLIEQGNTILIHQNPGIRGPGTLILDPETERSGDYVTRVFRLNTLDPNKASDLIRPLLSETAVITVLSDSNTIIITDVGINVLKIAELLKNLDAPIGGVEVGQYVAVQSLAASLVNTAEQILQPIAQGNPIQLVAHAPTNSIFIIGNPYLVERALALLRHLDTQRRRTTGILDLELGAPGTFPTTPFPTAPTPTAPTPTGVTPPTPEDEDVRSRLLQQGYRLGPSGEWIPPGVALSPHAQMVQGLPTGHIARTMFFIYKLKYRSGDQILQALRQVASSLSGTGTNEDLVNALNSIQWIEGSNSLIFTGTPESLERIKELINEIDVPLRQVFIEVLILDTTIRDSLTYGVDWASRFGGGDTAGSQAFLAAGSNLPISMDSTNVDQRPIADNLARLQGYHLGIVGRNLSKNGTLFQSIGALVTAIHTDARENIIMNPKILVEDNHTAELFVGSEQRLKTQSISNDQGSVLTNNFETVEIGTTLKVTPYLGLNDIITLEIIQENTNALPDANQASTQAEVDVNLVPIATKSKTTTRVHVPNKYFLILSGLVSDDSIRSGNRVPCLGGIPILGAGFRDKVIQDTKRNLMIFIRPEIIDTEDEYRRITERNQGIFDEKSKFRRSWNYEINEALDLFNLKRTDANERCSIYKEADCQTLCPCPSY